MRSGSVQVVAVVLGTVLSLQSATAQSLEASIERAAETAVAKAVPAPDRFEAVACRADVLGSELSVSEGRFDLDVVEVVGPNAFGVSQVHLRVLVDGKAAGEARATVRGVVRGPALVAVRPLARGVAVPSNAVEVRDAELTRVTTPPLRTFEDLSGLAPSRTVGVGQVVTRSDLRALPVVRRGGAVDLKVVGSSMTVTARGTARADGAPGDRIRAVNLATKVVVVGEVQKDGTLVVESSATGR